MSVGADPYRKENIVRREYSPYTSQPEPEDHGDAKRAPHWAHTITSGAIGVAIGAAIMIGASAIIGGSAPAQTTAEHGGPDYEIGGGVEQAVNYLEEQGIFLPTDEVQEIKDVACDGLERGRPSDMARDVVKYQTWTGKNAFLTYNEPVYDAYASEALAAIVITSCPENIGKLSLNPKDD